MQLKQFIENPDNPSAAGEAEIKRLAGKIKRVPDGLKALRIAYVTDAMPGQNMVISGNKRLRVLKEMYGDDWEIPDQYVQDVTSMSEEQRKEFIITANVVDGHWDLEKLENDYDPEFLADLGLEEFYTPVKTYDEIEAELFAANDPNAKPKEKEPQYVTCPHCGAKNEKRK